MYNKGKGTTNEDDNQSSSGGRRQSFNSKHCLGERRQLAWYLTDEGARDIQANIPDLQPLPPNATRIIQTQEPAKEYKRIQREAHTYPINVDTAGALERIAGTMETAAIKSAVSALTEVHEIMRYKAQICCGKRTRDNYFEEVWPEYQPKLSRQEDYYKKPKSSSICSDTQSEESEEDDGIVDQGWDDFSLKITKVPRIENYKLSKKTRYCRI
ncbi:hypothetical protein Tco_1342675 [Tanacetum coccineum]